MLHTSCLVVEKRRLAWCIVAPEMLSLASSRGDRGVHVLRASSCRFRPKDYWKQKVEAFLPW